MERRVFLISGLLLVAPLALASPLDDVMPAQDVRYVVGFHELPRDLESGDTYNGATVLRVDPFLHFAVVKTKTPSWFEFQASIDDDVRYVEPDPIQQFVQFTPNDARWADQYGPQQIRAPEAWDTTLGTTAKNVCIVDTGVRYSHEDLAGARWLGGYDYVSDDADPWDDNGHGTHVASTAAGSTNNGIGIAGVTQSGILGVKVLNALGSGSYSDIASGIRWCADNGGHVISMSLGGPSGQTSLLDAVNYAWTEGSLVVAAAGNDGPCSNCVNYPAKYSNAIAVTCTTSSETQCSFSSDGPESELAAPGQSILAAWHTSNAAYNTISGTSMSTPHVSGAAALVWSHAPGLTNSELRQLLRDHAQDLGASGWDQLYGYGEVDVKATLDAADGGGGGDPPPSQGTVYFEDFDDGTADDWTLTGLWHVSNACAAASSPPNYLAYNQDSDCEYSTGAATTGTATFSVDLSDATVATLKLDHRWETESYSGGAYDVMRVQASATGSSFSTLEQWDSRDNNQPSWGPLTVDLDAYAGATAWIRFQFDSVDSVSNNFAGWFIDDVEITSDGDGGTPPPNQPPTAAAGPDQTVGDSDGSGNALVQLDGAASSDGDGSIVLYEWSEDGSTIATGATPSVTFSVGLHTVTLTVTDDDGATDTDTVAITVNANQAPTASFTYDCAGLSCSFNAAASSDPDGNIASYAWTFGDGNTGSGVSTTHAYASEGTYAVTVTVTDNGGSSDDASDSVSVSEPTGPETVYFENFDDASADGWHKSSGTNDLWRVASDCVTANSGAYQMAFGRASPNCDYDVGTATGWARTPVIDLSSYSSATLRFAHFWETESYSGGAYDKMMVELSSNGGTSWTQVRQWDSRDANPSDWDTVDVDVSSYASSQFRVRFVFDTVDGSFNNYDGWYVDDVEVLAE